MENYTYRAEWSPESGEYVGVCIEFPSRYSRAPTAHEAIEAAQRMIAEEVADLSFNQWVVQKLARRNPPTLNDLFLAENRWTVDRSSATI